jgi:hypothetical protein
MHDELREQEEMQMWPSDSKATLARPPALHFVRASRAAYSTSRGAPSAEVLRLSVSILVVLGTNCAV